MDTRYLAVKLFGGKASSGAAESAALDFQTIAVNIFLKFIDVLEAAMIIIAGLFLIKLAKRYFEKIETTHEQQKTALNLLEKITSGFLIVVTFTLALMVVGLDLTLIVSVLTLGLSFGTRDVIKNYVAGLLILFKAPFEIGDVIKIRTFTGKVEKIDFQAITIRTFDRKEVTIHNSDLLTQPITNFSKTTQARIEISLLLGYGSDMRRAYQIFERILGAHPAVLKAPKYSVICRDFSDTGANVMLRFWVQKPCNILRVRSEITMQIQEAFDEDRVLAPYSREAGLDGAFGMNEARRARLKMFYGQPMLADLATQTAEQVAAVAAPGAAEEYADAEEPE